MELRYLLKQLMVLKFLTEGGREVQIDDPERERGKKEKHGPKCTCSANVTTFCQCTGFGRSFVVQQRSQSYITPTPDITAKR